MADDSHKGGKKKKRAYVLCEETFNIYEKSLQFQHLTGKR